MARYGYNQEILISEQIEILRDEFRRDVFEGNMAPTRIKIYPTSGLVDPFTEEVTYGQCAIWEAISGIVSTIGQDDILMGLGGRVKVGDASIMYHFNMISGIFLQHPIKEIHVLTANLSGIYQSAGYRVGQLSGQPLYIKFALVADRNE